MTYSVKEIYYTLQGEGAHTGRAAVFLRFAGCNLWTGLERDRAEAVCKFCDTDFVGTDGVNGGKFAGAEELAKVVAKMWKTHPPLEGGSKFSSRESERKISGRGYVLNIPPTEKPLRSFSAPLQGGGEKIIPYVVCTGGEPLLQLDAALVTALHDAGFEIGIETNGTLLPPPGIDWICVSPKADAEQKLRHGDELKLIYPQQGAEPERYAGQDFANFFLQPMNNDARAANTAAATDYCLAHPQWRLSLQTHKLIGIR